MASSIIAIGPANVERDKGKSWPAETLNPSFEPISGQTRLESAFLAVPSTRSNPRCYNQLADRAELMLKE